MARKLPWLTGGAGSKSGGAASAQNTSANRKRGPSPAGGEASSSRPKQRSRVRNSSSSPPPAPPPEEQMRQGLDGDDAYMMVEDVFSNTARIFTQHLHHAEYQRLKKAVAARKAAGVHPHFRTDGRTEQTSETRKKIAARAQGRRAMNALRNIGVDDDEDEDVDETLFQDPTLSALMNKERPAAAPLLALTGTRSDTKMAPLAQPKASGQKSSPPLASSELDDDDLDNLPRHRHKESNDYRRPKASTDFDTFFERTPSRNHTEDGKPTARIPNVRVSPDAGYQDIKESSSSRLAKAPSALLKDGQRSLTRGIATELDSPPSYLRRSALPPKLAAKLAKREQAEATKPAIKNEDAELETGKKAPIVPTFLL